MRPGPNPTDPTNLEKFKQSAKKKYTNLRSERTKERKEFSRNLLPSIKEGNEKEPTIKEGNEKEPNTKPLWERLKETITAWRFLSPKKTQKDSAPAASESQPASASSPARTDSPRSAHPEPRPPHERQHEAGNNAASAASTDSQVAFLGIDGSPIESPQPPLIEERLIDQGHFDVRRGIGKSQPASSTEVHLLPEQSSAALDAAISEAVNDEYFSQEPAATSRQSLEIECPTNRPQTKRPFTKFPIKVAYQSKQTEPIIEPDRSIETTPASLAPAAPKPSSAEILSEPASPRVALDSPPKTPSSSSPEISASAIFIPTQPHKSATPLPTGKAQAAPSSTRPRREAPSIELSALHRSANTKSQTAQSLTPSTPSQSPRSAVEDDDTSSVSSDDESAPATPRAAPSSAAAPVNPPLKLIDIKHIFEMGGMRYQIQTKVHEGASSEEQKAVFDSLKAVFSKLNQSLTAGQSLGLNFKEDSGMHQVATTLYDSPTSNGTLLSTTNIDSQFSEKERDVVIKASNYFRANGTETKITCMQKLQAAAATLWRAPSKPSIAQPSAASSAQAPAPKTAAAAASPLGSANPAALTASIPEPRGLKRTGMNCWANSILTALACVEDEMQWLTDEHFQEKEGDYEITGPQAELLTGENIAKSKSFRIHPREGLTKEQATKRNNARKALREFYQTYRNTPSTDLVSEDASQKVREALHEWHPEIAKHANQQEDAAAALGFILELQPLGNQPLMQTTIILDTPSEPVKDVEPPKPEPVNILQLGFPDKKPPESEKSLDLQEVINAYFDESFSQDSLTQGLHREVMDTSSQASSSAPPRRIRVSQKGQTRRYCEAPQGIWIQLKRYERKGAKKRNFVTVPDKISVSLANGKKQEYRVKLSINHQGSDPRQGHYTTYRPDAKGETVLCNDATVTPVHDNKWADATDSYLLYAEKVDELT
jgi:hypothetical protein